MKSGFCGSSSWVTWMSRRILLIWASTSFWISPVFCSRNWSTESVGPVSFLGGGGASGLVRLVWVALTSVSCLVNLPLPLFAGLLLMLFCATASGATSTSDSESARAKIILGNRY